MFYVHSTRKKSRYSLLKQSEKRNSKRDRYQFKIEEKVSLKTNNMQQRAGAGSSVLTADFSLCSTVWLVIFTQALAIIQWESPSSCLDQKDELAML